MARRIVAVVIAFMVLAGCASHEVVPSSGPRKPTTPKEVKLYQKHPQRYEDLGAVVVTITPDMKWDDRGDAPAVFEALKAQAAQRGANGLLLKIPSTSYDYLVTAGYDGKFYQVPARRIPRTAMAEAIFVLEE